MADTLLVIDFQKGVCKAEKPIENLKLITNLINQRIAHYRKANKPIIFIQHNDQELVAQQEPWQIIDELNHNSDDYYIQKTHANSFFETNLQKILDKLDVQSIEICGAQTEYCVDATIKFAHGLGYQLFMKHQATTTYDNDFLTAQKLILFYEGIWNQRFLTFID